MTRVPQTRISHMGAGMGIGDSGDPADHWAENAETTIRAPWTLLAMAGAAMTVSLNLLLFGEIAVAAIPRYLAGWAIAGLLGFTFVIAHRRTIERLRHDAPGFALSTSQLRAGMSLLWIGVALCGLHSWFFATELAS
jgi:hypothetical protein